MARSRSLADDESLLGRGILDSLGVVSLANFVETEFELVLSPDELVEEHFESLATLAALVERKCTERARAE